ncbi:MAG: hypothetical protein JXX28_19795 [Deltaproteobacteria bacterium]|nr:hypothetical protein [Deltaproteobacteria bacterium]
MTERLFRVHGVIPLALLDPDRALPEDRLSQRPATDRVRLLSTRLNTRDASIRDLFRVMIETMAGLESELRDLQRHVLLYEAGVTLTPALVALGGDGMVVPWSAERALGDTLSLVFTLNVRESDHLFSVQAQVEASSPDDGTELLFTRISQDQRDLIVAWVFQQQAMERRRDLDAAGPR